MTEAWEHIESEAILPLAPGVVAGSMNEDTYRFRNFSYSEVKSDLEEFISKLKEVNPTIKIFTNCLTGSFGRHLRKSTCARLYHGKQINIALGGR